MFIRVIFLEVKKCVKQILTNEQGLSYVWGFEKRPPGTNADSKVNLQDNNQKPTDVCPARTTAAMLLMMLIAMSCPNIAKPCWA